MQVPNYKPFVFNKIAIVGEAPSKEDESSGRPFSGMSGKLLSGLCSKAGIALNQCYLGNISQYRPPNNDITQLQWSSNEIQRGLEALRCELRDVKPNVVILLGNVALRAALNPVSPAPLKAKPAYSVSDWRGSFFVPDHLESPFFGVKCTCTWLPSLAFRRYEYTPQILFDVSRAKEESQTSSWLRPKRQLITIVSFSDILQFLKEIYETKPLISVDIEGGIDSMTCLSIATSPELSYIIPFTGHGGNFFSTIDEEIEIWVWLNRVLSNPRIPKVLQNSLYDSFVLLYSYKILIRGIVDDTMLKHSELLCELPKGLAFQTSIYTKEPYYKAERKVQDLSVHWAYCCKDSAVTYEINEVLESRLKAGSSGQRDHYHFNIAMLEPLLYMERRGIRYDSAKAVERQKEVQRQVDEKNRQLNLIAGLGYDYSKPLPVALNDIAQELCKKRSLPQIKTPHDLVDHALKDSYENAQRARDLLLSWGNLTEAQKGEFDRISGKWLNTKSAAFKDFLYRKLNLPPQYKERSGGEESETSDYESLLHLWKTNAHPVLRIALDLSQLRTRAQMLGIYADPDGRIRCGYNVVGTETVRIVCYTSPTGSGYNLQTIPQADRDLYLADEGSDFGQLDLAGADSWTVAAWLAFLGDRTMLDDLQAGLKPARILALLRRHGPSINKLTRDELRIKGKEVKKDDWDYFACKQGTHGICYLMGPDTLRNRIFIESDGAISLSRSDVETLRNLFLTRYHVNVWHQHVASKLAVKPTLVSPAGHVRHFFARREDALGQALAHEPQFNTTWCTNRATLNLWQDPRNKRPDGRLWIEPLHTVHDALCVQWPIERREWAVKKMRSYFQNPITIAGTTLIIPFEGAYGPSWGNTTTGTI